MAARARGAPASTRPSHAAGHRRCTRALAGRGSGPGSLLAEGAGWAALAAVQAAAPLAVLLATAAPAGAVLVSANTKLPRSPEAALRRAIPAVNPDMAAVQADVEEIGFYLRIPQRKPWGQMLSQAQRAQDRLKTGEGAILAAAPASEREYVKSVLDKMTGEDFVNLVGAINIKDADRLSFRVAETLEDVSAVEMKQAAGLPFLLPPKYRSYPQLTGRATAELVVSRPGGDFGDFAGEKRSEVTLQVELDGYSAPLTAGNVALLIQRGFYDGVELKSGDFAVYAAPAAPPPAGAAPEVPLEFKPLGQFEPQYRLPLDVQGGEELPVLPFSVYGAVAMARDAADPALADATQFFFHLYDRRTSGLGGLSFEEGEFPVFGYVTKGADVLPLLGGGDVIKSARLTAGAERLVVPQAPAPAAAEE